MNDSIKWFIERADYGFSTRFYGRITADDGRHSYLKIVECFTPELSDSGLTQPPFLDINEESAQRLFDEMYRAGLRPSATRRKENVDGIEKHLEDMRKIVSSKLKIEL